MTKRCTKCDTLKPVSEFNNDKTRIDGKFPWCKFCKRGGDAKWRAKNPERMAENSRRWYEENRERHSESTRRWREENRQRKAQTDAEYYAKNRERILAYTREWNANRLGNRPMEKPWPDSPCGYSAAHGRVRATRGSASWHTCVDCDGPAAEWSYRGGSDSELAEWGMNPRSEPILRPYSTEPTDYDPRCVSCHRKYDMNKEREAA